MPAGRRRRCCCCRRRRCCAATTRRWGPVVRQPQEAAAPASSVSTADARCPLRPTTPCLVCRPPPAGALPTPTAQAARSATKPPSGSPTCSTRAADSVSSGRIDRPPLPRAALLPCPVLRSRCQPLLRATHAKQRAWARDSIHSAIACVLLCVSPPPPRPPHSLSPVPLRAASCTKRTYGLAVRKCNPGYSNVATVCQQDCYAPTSKDCGTYCTTPGAACVFGACQLASPPAPARLRLRAACLVPAHCPPEAAAARLAAAPHGDVPPLSAPQACLPACRAAPRSPHADTGAFAYCAKRNYVWFDQLCSSAFKVVPAPETIGTDPRICGGATSGLLYSTN